MLSPVPGRRDLVRSEASCRDEKRSGLHVLAQGRSLKTRILDPGAERGVPGVLLFFGGRSVDRRERGPCRRSVPMPAHVLPDLRELGFFERLRLDLLEEVFPDLPHLLMGPGARLSEQLGGFLIDMLRLAERAAFDEGLEEGQKSEEGVLVQLFFGVPADHLTKRLLRFASTTQRIQEERLQVRHLQLCASSPEQLVGGTRRDEASECL